MLSETAICRPAEILKTPDSIVQQLWSTLFPVGIDVRRLCSSNAKYIWQMFFTGIGICVAYVQKSTYQYLWRRRTREGERERETDRKEKQKYERSNKYSSARARKTTHLRRVQHFLAGITLREQHEHGIRWRIPKNAKSQWKGLLKLYYDPENAEALHVDTISLPTALPCLKAARHVNACKCHEMSKFKIHVLRKWAVTATASEQCCARQPPKVTKKLEQSFQIHAICLEGDLLPHFWQEGMYIHAYINSFCESAMSGRTIASNKVWRQFNVSNAGKVSQLWQNHWVKGIELKSGLKIAGIVMHSSSPWVHMTPVAFVSALHEIPEDASRLLHAHHLREELMASLHEAKIPTFPWAMDREYDGEAGAGPITTCLQ